MVVSVICYCNWGSGAQQVRKSPHLEARAGASPCKVQRSCIVELLCLCVERAALLDCAEAGNLQRLARLIASLDPWRLLAPGRQLLAHDLAILVLGQVLCCHA